jgi:AcrR family transcriptional regulator
MTVSRQDSGRILQKRRTRLAIVEAAAGLLAQGRQPTVAEAADAALVSRATAYRYFRSQRALLLDVALQQVTLDIRPVLEQLPAGDAVARWELVCQRLFAHVLANEPLMRTALQVTQEEWLANQDDVPDLRQGRRLRLIEAAIDPLQGKLPKPEFKRLLCALAALIGVESYIALHDACGLHPDTALATVRWAGRTLIESALAIAD